jgi:hypothetical protein
MWLRICVALTIAVSLSLTSSPAAAGGYAQMGWDKHYNAVGAISVGRESHVWLRTAEAAQRALTGETPYFMYLDDDPYRSTGSWHGPGRDGIRVGTIQVTESRWGSNVVKARAEFEVPQVASGTYTAYSCDSGCHHVMGDLYPTSFVVVQSAVEGRLRARMDRMRQDLRSTARELRRQMGDATRRAVASDHDIRSDLAEDLDRTASDLDRRIDLAIGIARDRNALRDSAAWFAAGFTAALALAFVFWRRKQARGRLTLDDELAGLTGDRDRVPLGSRS